MPGKAIQSHVTLTKQKMKRDLGTDGNGIVSITATPTTPAGPSSVQKRPASGTTAATPSKKQKKDVSPVETSSEEEENGGESSAEEDSGDQSKITLKTEEASPPAAGPSLSKGKGKAKAKVRTTRLRSAPHSKLPIDYSKLNDPFTTMEGAMDSDGENVFGGDGGNTSEDTYSSDQKFEHGEETEGL